MTEPLGIASIAGTLNSHGHVCDVIFLSEEKDYLKYIKATSPDIVGFSMITGDTERRIEVMKTIKRHFNIPVIVGGPHATLYPEELLSQECIDICCVGDGELSALALLNKIDAGDAAYDIKNIYYKKNGSVIKNDLCLTDINTLHDPDKSIYYKYDVLKNAPMKRFITSYGCPYTCNYCWNHVYLAIFKEHGQYYRRKKCDKIIEEIRTTVEAGSHTRRIHFHDDIFNLPNSWLEEFCEKYKKAFPGLPWSCTVRIDLLNEGLIKKMKRGGCAGVTIGVETADEEQRMLFLGKKITNRQYIDTCRMLYDYRIKILSSNMTNLLFEKIEDAVETLRFNSRLRVFGMRPAILTIWKGQETFNQCVRHKAPIIPLDKDGDSFVIANHDLEKFRKLNCIYNFLYTFKLVGFWKVFIALPMPLAFFRLFRLVDGYLEMRFFGLTIREGVKYYFKIQKEYSFMQRRR